MLQDHQGPSDLSNLRPHAEESESESFIYPRGNCLELDQANATADGTTGPAVVTVVLDYTYRLEFFLKRLRLLKQFKDTLGSKTLLQIM